MSHASSIIIKETKEELLSAYHKQKNSRIKLKVKALILFQEGNYKKQEDLAMHLCIGYSTLRLWLRKYRDEGLKTYLKVPARGKPKCLVTSDLHRALEDKLKDSGNPLQSYLEAVEWVKEEHGIKLGYHALRKYMIKHFKTKLKVPRKSHYKKDEQAIEAFFKTARHTKSI
jgi:transposase